MQVKKSTKMRSGDFLMLLLIGLVAGGLFLVAWSSKIPGEMDQTNNELVATIEREGNKVAEIDLNSITEIQYITLDEGMKVVIEARPGEIRFLSSECPEQICVMAGWLTKKGHIAVCLPSKTVVSI